MDAPFSCGLFPCVFSCIPAGITGRRFPERPTPRTQSAILRAGLSAESLPDGYGSSLGDQFHRFRESQLLRIRPSSYVDVGAVPGTIVSESYGFERNERRWMSRLLDEFAL